jgi:hypothetical protein
MNQVTHLYHYQNFDHRDAVRRSLNQHQDWQSNYIDASRTIVSLQVGLVSDYFPFPLFPAAFLEAITCGMWGQCGT